MEPDKKIHAIFETHEDAFAAWSQLPHELQECIASPRQSHGCWIFDLSEQVDEWQS